MSVTEQIHTKPQDLQHAAMLIDDACVQAASGDVLPVENPTKR